MSVPIKIKTFKDLLVWQKSHSIVIDVYKITREFPKDEVYALTSQMRRCAVSITSNIAEGFSRQGTKEKIQFYFTAKGSLTELHNQLLIAKDVGYVNKATYTALDERIIEVGRIFTGLIRSISSL